MCLYKTHEEPRIAQNDIEVWKMLTSEGLSPFQNYPYHPGLNKPFEQKTMPVPAERRTISDGYLHAYRNKAIAETHASLLPCFSMENAIQYVTQRMLIPKGTVYYEGHSGDICAECLYWPEEETAAL